MITQSRPAGGNAPPLTRWEQAYQAFETPEQELRKFTGRLRRFGAHEWNRRLRILEVCSGRGTGLLAWHTLGFEDLLGVDLSAALVSAYRGPGRCVVGDARALPLPTASREVVVVQGGLHHLLTTRDVHDALSEMCRVTVPGGRILIVEPWLTPFLHFVHFVSSRPVARRLSKKLDAFATMTEEELATYERWLHAPDEHYELFQRHLVLDLDLRRWGKVVISGRPRVQATQ